jgi:hypothetical protein
VKLAIGWLEKTGRLGDFEIEKVHNGNKFESK